MMGKLPFSEEEIFIVLAHRWGERSDHTYLIGWSHDPTKAKKMADYEWEYRGRMKYSGVVYRMLEGSKNFVEVYRKGM